MLSDLGGGGGVGDLLDRLECLEEREGEWRECLDDLECLDEREGECLEYLEDLEDLEPLEEDGRGDLDLRCLVCLDECLDLDVLFSLLSGMFIITF